MTELNLSKDTHNPANPYENRSAYPHEPTVHDFYFYGTGAEYFKIWIVNLVLTMVYAWGVFTVGKGSPIAVFLW